MTARSAVRARSPFSATLSAVLASSSLTRGQRAALHQTLDAGKIDLRLVRLRLQRVDLRVERLHLQGELFVSDRRDRLAARDRIAFADVELDDDAADASARRNDADALDGGEHRLLVGDHA